MQSDIFYQSIGNRVDSIVIKKSPDGIPVRTLWDTSMEDYSSGNITTSILLPLASTFLTKSLTCCGVMPLTMLA